MEEMEELVGGVVWGFLNTSQPYKDMLFPLKDVAKDRVVPSSCMDLKSPSDIGEIITILERGGKRSGSGEGNQHDYTTVSILKGLERDWWVLVRLSNK